MQSCDLKFLFFLMPSLLEALAVNSPFTPFTSQLPGEASWSARGGNGRAAVVATG